MVRKNIYYEWSRSSQKFSFAKNLIIEEFSLAISLLEILESILKTLQALLDEIRNSFKILKILHFQTKALPKGVLHFLGFDTSFSIGLKVQK